MKVLKARLYDMKVQEEQQDLYGGLLHGFVDNYKFEYVLNDHQYRLLIYVVTHTFVKAV
jgi:hypothetical protein